MRTEQQVKVKLKQAEKEIKSKTGLEQDRTACAIIALRWVLRK